MEKVSEGTSVQRGREDEEEENGSQDWMTVHASLTMYETKTEK